MTPDSRESLPLDQSWPDIRTALLEHSNLVLVAEPGAGKTTRFPPLLLNSGLIEPDKKILMLEPRRLAARAAAHRIAEEWGWQVGNEVGYQVRFENRVKPTTRLQILTEGLLSRRLLSDPELRDTSAVILDEFHERSRHTDIALSLLFELQELARPDLRIIVMSATIDANLVARFLKDCPIISVPGRTHPVSIHYSRKPLILETGPRFLDSVADLATDVMFDREARAGDVLVFLPGTREIRGVHERIEAKAAQASFICHELHGSLSLEEQDRAIRKTPGQKKIVLATNIAETSLTIDGVGTVIDSGLARVMRLDSALGFERLQLSRISLASATQRAGRAGRQGPGHCHRLWTKLDESSMAPFEEAELKRTELTDTLLLLLSQGVSDPLAFSWLEAPPSSAITFALNTLTDLGFRDPVTSQLTELGKEALKLPLGARLARLVLEAARLGKLELGATIAALLSEKDIVKRGVDLKRHAHQESDVLIRLHLLEDTKNPDVDRFTVRNVKRVANLLSDIGRQINGQHLRTSKSQLEKFATNDDELTRLLLLLAFPDRVARRRRPKEPQARMVGGKGITLSPRSVVETSLFFVALDSQSDAPIGSFAPGAKSDATITTASSIERPWLETFFPNAIAKQDHVVFDETTLSAQRQQALCFRDLPLEEPHISRPDPDEALPLLVEAALRRWETHIAPSENLNRWLDRLAFVRDHANEPLEIDFDVLKRTALEEAAYGEVRFDDILNKPLAEIFSRHLPPNVARLMNEFAPETIVVPSGSRIRVHYPASRSPYLEVRIQEVFGWHESPRVAGGKIPVVLHLLGPNFRPVQVTSDLKSFWSNGYAEVRKELRARYPKHSWPEDPLTAAPEAKGRRR